MKKLTKRFLSAIIILSLVFTVSAVYVYAEDPTLWDGETIDYSWYNWQDTEFTITTAAQLAGLAYITGYPDATYGAELIHGKQANHFLGETIKLGADIDLGGHPWLSICCNPAFPFLGTFDGNGHTIKNLYNNETNNLQNKNKTLGTYPKEHFGLFGYMLGTVKNLCIEGAMWDFEVTQNYLNNYGGGIAAVLGTRSDVNSFSGQNTVPAPEDYSPRMENCCVKNITYNLSNPNSYSYGTNASMGGLVGAIYVGSVEECYVNGISYNFTFSNAETKKYPTYFSAFANIIDYKGLDTDSYRINNCYSANSYDNIPFAKINSTYAGKYTFTNCYSTSNISSSATVQNTYAVAEDIVSALVDTNGSLIVNTLNGNGYPMLTFEVPPILED